MSGECRHLHRNAQRRTFRIHTQKGEEIIVKRRAKNAVPAVHPFLKANASPFRRRRRNVQVRRSVST